MIRPNVEIVKRSRDAHEEWNAMPGNRFVPWEWVEEALYANAAWQDAMNWDSHSAPAHKDRYAEFAAKLPSALLEECLPGVEFAD